MAGVGINERSETAFDEVFRHWKKMTPKIRTLENATAAKARKAPAFSRSQAPHEASCAVVQTARLALFSWLVVAAQGGIGVVGEWSPSVRSLFLFARAPENEDEKTG
ncbi:MAG TPA: hypothetical protein PK634_08700, partial [Kiritimatiellia bacterium]|nr:hypothetical protein [Kiritimatiellia bacterium]HSA19638.1 hypothetical protein [Kiritimatiellia bacterium]